MDGSQHSIRVLTVDDHPVMRDGIAAVLGAQGDIDVVAEAGSGREAVDRFRRFLPDVTLMDLQMPDLAGDEAIEIIRGDYPAARIVVLTTYDGDVQILRALRAGAMGYLLKTTLRTELVATIRSVYAGRRRIPADVAAQLAEHAGDECLSQRETDVLREVASGRSNKEIGRHLYITEGTVKAHLKSIMAKLAVRDRTHAVTVARQRGILCV